jgi:glutamate dehydrogenase
VPAPGAVDPGSCRDAAPLREAALVNGHGTAPDPGATPEPASWWRRVASLLPGADAAGEAERFAARTQTSYRERTSPEEAALDLAELGALAALPEPGARSGPPGAPDGAFGGHHLLAVRPALESDGRSFRIRRYGEQGIELTRFLPVLESFGLVVVESVPYLIGPGAGGEPAVHIDDVGVRVDSPVTPEELRFVPEVHGPRLVAALDALARGETEVDSLNRLVTVAGLDWRQVTVLRAYLRYWLQGDTAFSAADLADPLVCFPEVARSLIGYFQSRFSPDRDTVFEFEQLLPDQIERTRCVAELDLVPQLQQDQVLRGYLRLIDATLRTNFFRVEHEGGHRAALALKFDSASVPDLPAPRPKVETFVHSPTVEGIHLRAGLVARGGVRWSERPGDFRTEVLDLAFAQVKKNAIIVPTGAKGGFVCRPLSQSGRPGGVGIAGPEEVRAAYETFVRALLDVTDNLVAGEVVNPPYVVARDGPDPYLVVAADKGTATYSDLANSLSEEYGFWLGDAFASGGSHGYDHKRLGITARGAWVAVRLHFRQLGIDVQVDPIRVAGVGDMSGDVFGNGMLCSQTIKLVAAFDHRHVFLDPDPDPVASYAERARLAALPHSSWADYRSELISAGGGVWPRTTKLIPLAPAAQRALAVTADALSPPEVISAILTAPVDLLWFGGIGTFVKDPDEPDGAVGDHANDAVRVTADQVRARVVTEGGNLGVTQRARIRYSRRGGRINTDFIDNAAGVAMSDREVNLKILLARAIEENRLDPAARDSYLERSEAEVTRDVLRQVDHSVAALSRSAPGSARQLDAYEALIDTLEDAGRFNRQVEDLPSPDELRVRREAGAGLIRPELAVLLAYAKSDLVSAIEHSSVVDDPALLDAVAPYFPGPIRQAFDDLIPQHRLYPQLVATNLAGEIVDQLGIVWAHESGAELGRDLSEVAASFWAARQVLRAGDRWAELEERAAELSADAEAALHATIGDAVERLARAYLTSPGRIHVEEVIARDAGPAESAVRALSADATKADEDSLVALGVDRELAHRFVLAAARAGIAEAGPVARRTGRSVADAAEAVDLVNRAAGGDRLTEAVARALETLPAPPRLTTWQGRALLDDLSAWRKAAAAEALANPGPPVKVVAEWETVHQAELARAGTLLSTLTSANADPLAVTALVLRRLQLAL